MKCTKNIVAQKLILCHFLLMENNLYYVLVQDKAPLGKANMESTPHQKGCFQFSQLHDSVVHWLRSTSESPLTELMPWALGSLQSKNVLLQMY